MSLPKADQTVPPNTDQGVTALGRHTSAGPTETLIPIKVEADGTVVTSGGATASSVTIDPYTGLAGGTKSVALAATPEALAASTAIKAVVVQAQRTNTSFVSVGATGGEVFDLFPLDSITLMIDDLSKVFVAVQVNGEGVNFLYFT